MPSRRFFPIPQTLGVVLILSSFACGRPDARNESACSTDAECLQGSVCRIARCRKACSANHWVGQGVHVSGEKSKRSAVVSGCDGVMFSPAASASLSTSPTAGVASASAPTRLWVRYETGIEEQVPLARITPAHDVQAHAKGVVK